MCGSFGKGVEGQLLACAQCAQCYHPYCVNSKVRTMLYVGCLFLNIFLLSTFSKCITTIFGRLQRQSFVKVGDAWSVLYVKCVERRQTPLVCCCVMTATSAIIPTAWTHPCTLYQRVAGSANGTYFLSVQYSVHLCSF